MKKQATLVAAAPVLLVLAVLAQGCSQGAGGPDNIGETDCDYLIIPGIADDEVFRAQTERNCGVGLSLPLDVFVDFIATNVDSNPTFPGNSISTFVLDRYIVTYRNRTRGNASVAGVDVPFPFEFTPAAVVGAGGNFPAMYELLGAPVLMASAKGQAPLNTDIFYRDRTDPLSGVVLEATITFWGYPVGQPRRACSGTMVFLFTVYDASPADDELICLGEFEIESGG